MNDSQIINVLEWAVPIVGTVLVFIVGWAFGIERHITSHKSDNVLQFSKHEGRLIALEKNVDYLIGVGADLKKDQAAMILTVAQMQISMNNINVNVEKIMTKLDKQDDNIAHYYHEMEKQNLNKEK